MPSIRLQIVLVVATCALCGLSVWLFGFHAGVNVLLPWSLILFVLAARYRTTFYATLGFVCLFFYFLLSLIVSRA